LHPGWSFDSLARQAMLDWRSGAPATPG
jgi:hypothetical protein